MNTNGRRAFWLVFTTVSVVMFCFAACVSAQPGKRRSASSRSAQRPLRIGVVNITKVFNGYYKRSVREREVNTEREKKQAILKERRKAITRLQQEIELLDMGSQERKEKEKELQKQKIEYETSAKMAAQAFRDRLRNITAELYQDIADAITNYGKTHGYDVILKVEDFDLQSSSIGELQDKIALRIVLYYSKSVDLTDEILSVLNKDQDQGVEE